MDTHEVFLSIPEGGRLLFELYLQKPQGAERLLLVPVPEIALPCRTLGAYAVKVASSCTLEAYPWKVLQVVAMQCFSGIAGDEFRYLISRKRRRNRNRLGCGVLYPLHSSFGMKSSRHGNLQVKHDRISGMKDMQDLREPPRIFA